MFFAIISILAGVSIVLARIINSALASKIGTFQGTLINYIVGLFFSVIFLFISNEFRNAPGTNFGSLPLWAYTGGLLGVIVVTLSNYITMKVSAFYLTLLIFVGQLFSGIAIDYLTAGDISIGKILGGILVLAGLTYNLLLDKNRKEPA
ncbi:MAG: hypothetical protein K0R50_2205 [Eubacterium sp.]|jgi:transporter family-2 protein|nr:hypothetical protein [Eubacterium sp.]